jgi:hypothetical protein
VVLGGAISVFPVICVVFNCLKCGTPLVDPVAALLAGD